MQQAELSKDTTGHLEGGLSPLSHLLSGCLPEPLARKVERGVLQWAVLIHLR
jgi:hypothetical protein